MDILDLTGAKLREMRDNLSWTREFLSERSGIPVRTIADIETGASKNPGLETIKALISALPNYQSNQNDRASRILDIQEDLRRLSDEDLETVHMTIINLVELAQNEKINKASKVK